MIKRETALNEQILQFVHDSLNGTRRTFNKKEENIQRVFGICSPNNIDRFPEYFFCIAYFLKVLWNANACWLVLIYNTCTMIITNVAKRLFIYVPYILL